MENSKIRLSEEELLLVRNSRWILTKHGIIEKVYRMFGHLSQQMQSSLQASQQALPPVILGSSPKISKGERYEELPYVVLDYPRCFSKENVFAVRTFFWWGNYFSISLHLKGNFKTEYNRSITRAIDEGQFQGYHLSMQGNEFNFNVDSEDYEVINTRLKPASGQVETAPFLKIACKYSFDDWDMTQLQLLKSFQYFINACTR